MKRLIILFLVIGVTLFFFGCSENNSTAPEFDQSGQLTTTLAKKPSPNLIGTAVADFGFISVDPLIVWQGEIDFGGITYGLTFISHGAPRDYSQASPFYEDFIIYEYNTDWTIPANVYMKGWNAGVVTYANKIPDPVKFLANGKITEAYGPFEMWQGRNVHIKGEVVWNLAATPLEPDYAESTFRIN